MNRYVQEVAEMDRRRARTLRVLSVAGVTALVFAAFWSAGVPMALWSAVNRYGDSPLADAESSGQGEAAALLRARGAQLIRGTDEQRERASHEIVGEQLAR